MSMTIQTINSAAPGAAAAAGVRGPLAAQRPEAAEPAPKPAMDEYIPEEKREPSGRYWLERDEDGQLKVHVDREESCTGNTDAVDREIERLKRKREELEQRIERETDSAKEALEKELAQVERELSQKDNDTYRRQHTVFS